ncbi:hypothetical protein NC652_001574 [Populus alba x Populus x berolinensis]|nr:hypothetical protein NC652_001574 [Populus alba x Populus x berolinensis]
MGLTPLSDATGLTSLLQESEVQGSQIKNKGKWVPTRSGPIIEAIVGPLPELVEERGAEYIRLVITRKLDGGSHEIGGVQ